MEGKRHDLSGRSTLLMAMLGAGLLAGCGGGDDPGGTDDPLIEEGSNVIPSGTGPGVDPAPTADSIITGDGAAGTAATVGGAQAAPGGAVQDTVR